MTVTEASSATERSPRRIGDLLNAGHGADLDWLVDILGPGTGAPVPYLARPSADQPSFLVPTRPRRAAAAALARFDDDRTAKERAIGLAARGLARTGLLAAAPGDAIELPRFDLVDELALALGEPTLVAAVTLGPRRRNRKPVLQLLTPDGRTAGFAKVGWSALTAELVDAEVAALERIDGQLPPTIGAPVVLHHQSWRTGPVAVVTALDRPPHPGRLRRRKAAPSPTGLVAAIASVGRRDDRRVDELELWPMWAESGLADQVDVETFLARHGTVRLTTGLWHGDLTPWNISTTADRVWVWDWELSGEDRPLGFDRLHQLFELTRRRHSASTLAALATMVARSARALQALDIANRRTQAATVDLYLCELIAREHRLEGQRWTGGTATDLSPVAGELLRRRLDRPAPAGTVRPNR